MKQFSETLHIKHENRKVQKCNFYLNDMFTFITFALNSFILYLLFVFIPQF